MHITVLHNHDHALLEEDPGREAREDVVRVAAAMVRALQGAGRSVEAVAVDQTLFDLHESVARRRPDVVVNLCESLAADSRGEMVVPAVLELLGLPYTGSPAMALGLALHKHRAKEVLRARGITTPAHAIISRVEDLVGLELAFPLIVKPSREDASVGIDFDSVARDRAALGLAVAKVLRTFRQPAIVEQYIEGREVSVPLLGNSPRRALPITEISFGAAFVGRPNIVSYRAKWDLESAECIESTSALAVLEPALEARCAAIALAAFDALECRDYGRVDLRIDAEGRPWVIDINPNCDLHPQAGFSKAAAAAGIAWPDLALHLVELASERSHGHQTPRAPGPVATRRAAGPHRDLFAGRSGLRPRAHRRRTPAE